MRKAVTAEQKKRWARLRELGCIVGTCDNPNAAIHHCETGMGGRKDHDKVIPLCHYHHQGEEGLHTLGRRVWQGIYGTEQQLMEIAEQTLRMP